MDAVIQDIAGKEKEFKKQKDNFDIKYNEGEKVRKQFKNRNAMLEQQAKQMLHDNNQLKAERVRIDIELERLRKDKMEQDESFRVEREMLERDLKQALYEKENWEQAYKEQEEVKRQLKEQVGRQSIREKTMMMDF